VKKGRCVIFAYSEVGVRCLKVLHSMGADIALVVTHRDDPNEHRWYGSVAETAAGFGIPVIEPESAADPALLQRLQTLQPDFIFSFYYRHMIGTQLLATARRGALNMHGSLLPKFRGRAPVNWAVAKGATETGATLHYMVEKPDAGEIVGQQAVPILGDDNAREVFDKVVVAAETVLWVAWPKLLDGAAPRIAQDLTAGSYFGRRTPEDGRIDWRASAKEIHDLVRAVAPPYPGAFTDVQGVRLFIHRTQRRPSGSRADQSCRACLQMHGDDLVVECADGEQLNVLESKVGDETVTAWMRRSGLDRIELPG
jgi:methionyl-tRNA formyltransferase